MNIQTTKQNKAPEQPAPARHPEQTPHRNPRIVIGTLDYFDMLMEQDEEG